MKNLLSLIIVISFASGCAITFEPRDLELHSIYLLNNPFEEREKDRSLFRIKADPIDSAEGEPSHLAIVLSTSMNLFHFSEKHDFNIGYDIKYCSPPSGILPRISGGGLYTKSGYRVSRSNDIFNRSEPEYETQQDSTNRYYYIALLRTSGPGNRIGDSSTHYDAYDLRNVSSDLCVRLSGGAMWGYSLFKSNEFTVPRGLILDALRQNQ